MHNGTKERRPPLNNRCAALYSGLSEGYLNKLRVTGGGPTYIKVLGRVLYSPDDIDAWFESHKRQSTSQEVA